MAAPYLVEAVANTILDSSVERRVRVDPLKLQKLIYLAHGYHLASQRVGLINEAFQAWPYGPVVPTIYHAFKHLGSKPIPDMERAQPVFYNETEHEADELDDEFPTIPFKYKNSHNVIQFVLNTYGDKSGVYLSDLTHKIGSPWEKTRTEAAPSRNSPIPNDLIQEYFRTLLS